MTAHPSGRLRSLRGGLALSAATVVVCLLAGEFITRISDPGAEASTPAPGEAQFTYDETGLWMRFLVTDDVFHQPNTGPDIWEADSVQVGIRAGDVTHAFGYALTPDGPKAFRYGSEGGAGSLSVRREGGTLTYDVRIPWAALAPLTGLAGERFRMNFMVNENDGHGRRGWLELRPGIGTGDDPDRWIEFTLGDR